MNHTKKPSWGTYPNKRLTEKISTLDNARSDLKQATQRLKAQNDRLAEKLRK